MITYIKGRVEHVLELSVIIDNNGIGYEVFISSNTIKSLIKKEIKIFTYTHIKEDSHTLYGFLTLDELNVFKMLISVSGIGPKVGLGILSEMNTSQIMMSIVSEDVILLSKAPGVGKKTAQKIILELKDKIKTKDAIAYNSTATQQNFPIASNEKQEAIEALIALGYTRSESVRAALETYVDDMTTEQIIKSALKKLANTM